MGEGKGRLYRFVDEKLRTLGTSACPPYHVALVIGGTSAELTLKTVKLASCHALDDLPTSGNEHGRAFRDLESEDQQQPGGTFPEDAKQHVLHASDFARVCH